MSDSSLTHVLTGLDADNLLAFLALLGLMRAIDTICPDWNARVRWEGMPQKPALHVNKNISQLEIALAVQEYTIRYRKAYMFFDEKTSLVPTKDNKNKKIKEYDRIQIYSKYISNSLSDINMINKHISLSALSSLIRLVVRDGDYIIEDTPLKLASGQQEFVGSMRNLFALSNEESKIAKYLIKSLFFTWKNEEKKNSLRLSPEDDRRYAYRFHDPSPEGSRSEWGANLLAAIGMTSLCLIPGKTEYPLIGYRGKRNDGYFTWPIWNRKITYKAITHLMIHQQIVRKNPDMAELQCLGVDCLMRCRRYRLPSGKGDYGNVSLADAIYM